jgi:hypothetical protein
LRRFFRNWGLAILATATAAVCADRGLAIEAWLGDSELVEQFKNTTINGRYANGKAFTETYAADGRLTYVEAGVSLAGHWSVREGTFCTIYDADAAGGCYRVTRVGPNCFEFFFVSRTEETAPGPTDGTPRWTARAAIQGKPTACKDEPAV